MAKTLYADGISASSMLVWRYGLALVPLVAAIGLMRLDFRRALRSGAWKIAAVGATLGAGQTLCFWESIRTVETGVAVLLFYTYPAITLALDRLVYGRPIRPLAVVCIGAILCGAAMITAPGISGGTIDTRGLLWLLPSPLIYALYLVLVTNAMRRHPSLIGAACLYFGMVVTFGVAAVFAGLDVPSSDSTWLLLVLVAIVPGALTTTLFSYSAPRLGPSSYAIVANTELVTVVAVGALFLGEPVTAGRVLGGLLIVGGIITHALARQRLTASPQPTAEAPPSPASLRSAPSPAMREREGPTPSGVGG
jgi:drug/metabolite transporter (DMT)-like permease